MQAHKPGFSWHEINYFLKNGSYQEGMLDYMDKLAVVKEVDWVFIG
jgi:hypothetical protein